MNIDFGLATILLLAGNVVLFSLAKVFSYAAKGGRYENTTNMVFALLQIAYFILTFVVVGLYLWEKS